MIMKICHGGEKSHLILDLQVKSDFFFFSLFFHVYLLSSHSYYYLQHSQMNVFVNDNIVYGYVGYVSNRYFALFIAAFVGKYNSSSSDLF